MGCNYSEKDIFIEDVKRLILDGRYDKLLEFEDIVIDKNIAELSYWYAYNVKGSNIKRHEDVVSNSKDLMWIFSFARDVKGADINRLDNLIIDSGDAYFNYISALCIDGVDILKHGMIVFLSGDAEYNYLFAKNIKGSDIKLHEKAVAISGDERFINKFMRDIKEADLDFLSNAVIKRSNPYWNYVVAKNYGINVLKHGEVIYKSLDPEYNYLFAREVDGADLKLHGQALLLSNNKEYIKKYEELLLIQDRVKKLIKDKGNNK